MPSRHRWNRSGSRGVFTSEVTALERLDDAGLVRRAVSGDEAAYEALVADNRVLAVRTAVLLGAGDDADDVVQEAFVKAYRRLSTFRGDASFRSWLLTIVANETRNLHRTRQRRTGLLERAAAQADQPDDSDLALDGALTSERRAELVSALRQLSPADRDVIVYRYLLDMSEAETAALLDRPKGTVKSRANRALAKLRTQLIVWIIVILAVVTAVVVPPVRSAVADVIGSILRLGGIEVNTSAPSPSIAATPSPIPSSVNADLATARSRALFVVGVPKVLGEPSSVVLGDVDQRGAPRLVTLFFRGADGRPVRLDEFDGHMSPDFSKKAGVDDLEWVTVKGQYAIWLGKPHAIAYIDREGVERVETARTAGPTLAWEIGAVTYRLEGVADKNEALRIAESVG
jgi:RNA polymerase sigma-70 factor, ECF subfamily